MSEVLCVLSRLWVGDGLSSETDEPTGGVRAGQTGGGSVESSSNAKAEPTGNVSDGTKPESPVTKVEPRHKAATKRVLVWLLFGAFFGLMPLFAVTLKETFTPTGFNIDDLLKGGDLFIVSAVLSAGAMGELLAAASEGGMSFYFAIISGFFCLATFAGDSIAYVVAGSAPPAEIATASLWFFPLTLLASGLCIGTAAYS